MKSKSAVYWLYVGLGTCAACLCVSPARGQTNSWINGTGKWEDGANWSSGGPPFNGESVFVTNATSKTVTIDTNTTADSAFSLTIRSLALSAPGSATNTLRVVNADAVPFLMNTLFVGPGGSLLVSNTSLGIAISNTISNGHMLVLNTTGIPSAIGSTNFVFVVTGSSATFSNSGPTAFENALNNSVVVTNGGRLDTDDLYLGFNLSNVLLRADFTVVTVTGTNSQLNSHILSIGEVGSSNQFTVGNGATMHIKSALRLSSTATSLGNLMQVLPGGTLMVGDNVFVGNTNGAGATMKISGGLSSLASNLITASFANSTDTVSITGGQLVTTNGVIGVGNDGTATNGFGVGTMTVSNGTVLGSQVLLGSSVGGRGQLTVQTNGLVSLVGTGAVLLANDVTVDGGDVEIVNGIIYCGRSHPGAMTMSNGTANSLISYVGYDSQGTLTMVAGQMTVSSLLEIGFSPGSTGSVWMSGGQLTATTLPTIIGNSGVGQLSLSNGTIQASTLFIGTTGAPGGTLTVIGGTLTLSAGLTVGTGTVWVSGGQLVTPSIVIGSNGIGQITLSNGLVQASNLVLTNGANSRFAFPGGTLSTGGTVVTNTQRFVVGNGSGAALFNLMGGVHWFGNGLEITSNSTLTGCGTINGTVTIDTGGVADVTCGTLTFNGSVTNNGTMLAFNGNVLQFNGAVVNNGLIDALSGAATFQFQPTGSGYVLTTNCIPTITAVQKVGADIHVSFTTCTNAPYAVDYETDLVTGSWTTLMSPTGTSSIVTITDSGAALLPKRFYRVNLVVPP